MLVKVFSTQMGEREVETNATTWGDLQNDLKKQSIGFSKMKAVIGETKLTLEADGAMLPAQGFTLFLMNKKTKAGGTDVSSLSYKELRKTINVILKMDEDAKDHFNEGKNYTTKSTPILREMLESYSGVVPTVKECEDYIPQAIKKGRKKHSATVIKEEKAVKVDKPKKIKGNKTKEPVMKPVDEPIVPEPIKEEAPKKKNAVIEAANNAVADVVESVKVSKEEKEPDYTHSGLQGLQRASEILDTVDIKDLDRELQEDIESLTARLGKKYKKAAKIHSKRIVAQKEAEKEAKEAAEKEAKRVEEEEAKRKEEEEAKAEEKAKENKLAKEKSDAEAKVAEEKKESANKLKNQMNDLMGEFGDVS